VAELSNSIVHWERDLNTGALTNQINLIDATNLLYPQSVAVSSDSKNVYAMGYLPASMNVAAMGSIVQWDRDMGTGALTNQINLIDGTNLKRAYSVTVSPDGKNVYAVAQDSKSIVHWERCQFYAVVNPDTSGPACVMCADDTMNYERTATDANTCASCAAGSYRTQDMVTCGGILCSENEHVVNHVCVACPPGKLNAEGDDASGQNTDCDIVYCGLNERVSNHACTACPQDTLRDSGDDSSGDDTTCASCAAGSYRTQDMVTCVGILCSENEHVVNHVCVACPPGQLNAEGDDTSGQNTDCDSFWRMYHYKCPKTDPNSCTVIASSDVFIDAQTVVLDHSTVLSALTASERTAGLTASERTEGMDKAVARAAWEAVVADEC
jgi:hypothetical protein